MMNISYLTQHHGQFHPAGGAYVTSLPSPATPGDPSLFFVPSSAAHSTTQSSQITLPSSSSAFHTYYASPSSARSSFDASGTQCSSSSSGQVGISLPSIMSGFPSYVDDSMSVVGIGATAMQESHHSSMQAMAPSAFVQQQQQHQQLQYQQQQQEQAAVASMMADQQHQKIMTMLKVPDAEAAAATVAGPPMLPPISFMQYSASMAPHLSSSQQHQQQLQMPMQGSLFDSTMMNTGSCGASAGQQVIVDQQPAAVVQHIPMTMDSSAISFDEQATVVAMADMNAPQAAAMATVAAEPAQDARPTRRGKRPTVSASSTPSLGPEQSNAQSQVRRRTAQNTQQLPRQCYNCSTTYTSQWRTDGQNRLCNKCGLYWERKGHMRPGPFDLTVKRRKRKKDGDEASEEFSPGMTGMPFQQTSPRIDANQSQSSVDTASSQGSASSQDSQTTGKRGKKRNTPPAASKGKGSAKNKRKKTNSVAGPGNSVPLFGGEVSAAEEAATAAAAADATPTAFVETFSHVSLDSQQQPEFANIKLEQSEQAQPVLQNMPTVPLVDPSGQITLQLSKEEIQLALIALQCYQNQVPCPVPALLPSIEPTIMTDTAINSLVPLTMAMGSVPMHASASSFAAQDQHASTTGFR